jgi:hypothetical protein
MHSMVEGAKPRAPRVIDSPSTAFGGPPPPAGEENLPRDRTSLNVDRP